MTVLAVSEGVEVGIGVIRREKIRCLLLPGLLLAGLFARVCFGGRGFGVHFVLVFFFF